MTGFFYYEMTPTGRWTPVMSTTQPVAAKADGQKVKIAGLVILDGEQVHLTFGECREKWPVGWWEEKAEVKKARFDKTKARKGETIGGGYFVFRRGDGTNRVRPSQLPFEHGSLAEAEDEAKRLSAQRPGYTFDVFARVATHFTGE